MLRIFDYLIIFEGRGTYYSAWGTLRNLHSARDQTPCRCFSCLRTKNEVWLYLGDSVSKVYSSHWIFLAVYWAINDVRNRWTTYLFNQAFLYDFDGVALLRGIMNSTPYGTVCAFANFRKHFKIPDIFHGPLAVIPGCLALLGWWDRSRCALVSYQTWRLVHWKI